MLRINAADPLKEVGHHQAAATTTKSVGIEAAATAIAPTALTLSAAAPLHWSRCRQVRTLTFRLDVAGAHGETALVENFAASSIGGGSERGQLVYVDQYVSASWSTTTTTTTATATTAAATAATGDDVDDRRPFHLSASLQVNDIVLEVDSHPVSGFTRQDAIAWINHCALSHQGVVHLTVAPLSGTSNTPHTPHVIDNRNV